MKLAKLNKRNRVVAPQPPVAPIRLDFGSGPNGKPGFLHVDCIAFPGVDMVFNVVEPIYAPIPKGFEWMASAFERKAEGFKPWPWADNSIEEGHASHFLEHLPRFARWHFLNELYRVLKPGSKCTLVTPDWSSQRAYGDMTHEWPPVSGFHWFYLSKEWRKVNAPHNDAEFVKGGLNCNFAAQWGPTLHPDIASRNQEYIQHAITFWKEACQDSVCTLTKC